MKGVVFTEFIEMVEDTFSLEMADRIIEASDLPTGGAYTSVGTYDHEEMLRLAANLSKETGIPQADLMRNFGTHLFGRFFVHYPQFFEGITDAFSFLKNIEQYIHVEVQKLYPDAELPSFEYEHVEDSRMTMIYRSRRPFATLAEGLIVGCIQHFQEEIDIKYQELSTGENNSVRFELSKRA